MTDVQHRILGKEEDEEIYEFHVHLNAPDPEFDHEQPEAVLAARKKAREEQRQRELEAM